MDIRIKKKNEVWFHVYADQDIRYELMEHFQFDVPNAKFSPKYKMGFWDGKIKLFNPMKSLLHIGLLSDLKAFCADRNYSLAYERSDDFGDVEGQCDMSYEDVQQYVNSLDIHSGGKSITPHDYQYEAVYQAIKFNRRTFISATSSGKSLMIYAMCRYYISQNKKCLLICPTVQLVSQMYADFNDYSSNNGWDSEKNIHKIYAGQDKTSDMIMTIATWQSLAGMTSQLLCQYEVVIVDETHTAAAKCLADILENCTHAKVKIGLTGSLTKSKTNSMVIKGLLGDIVKISSAKDLIERGLLSEIKISAIMLNYSKDTKKSLKKADYKTEIDFLTSHEKRNKFIRNLALSLKGNTLILFNFVEGHGELLKELFYQKTGDKLIRFIHGDIDVDFREDTRKELEENENIVILASFGTTKQGVNFKNLKNIIFAHPTKSIVTVLQSIGRGLRKVSGKTHVHLYDIGDKLADTKKKNHTYDHFAERLSIYAEQEFEYKLIEMDLEK
mgnify:CR=1 FL=1